MKTTLTLTALLALVALSAPSAQAEIELFDSTPDVQCMDYYSETYLFGHYWLVRRDSCSAQLYECPEGYNPPAPPCQEAALFSDGSGSSDNSASAQLECYPVYSRTDVEQVTIIRRNSCAPPEVYQCPYQGAPLGSCRPLLGGLVTAESQSSTPEPNCMDYYYEVSVGPVTHVQRDSCHSENYVCEDDDGVHESDETVDAFLDRQVAEPGTEETQACVGDFLGRYVAWT